MKFPVIQEAWDKRISLRCEGNRLQSLWLDLSRESRKHLSKSSEPIKDSDGDLVTDDDGYTCYTDDVFYAEGERLRAESKKNGCKSYVCFAEGDRIYCEAVIEKYGQKSVIDWNTGEIEQP